MKVTQRLPGNCLTVLLSPASTSHFSITRSYSSSHTHFGAFLKINCHVPSAGCAVEEEIRILGRGEYFGEKALIKEDKRTANIIAMSPGVECLTLDRESFSKHIGDLCELHEKDYGDEQRVLAFRNLENNNLPSSLDAVKPGGNSFEFKIRN